MEQLPLTFVQSTVEQYIQECFNPAFNISKINSSNGRLAFTTGKVYWLPDSPMAIIDQGWVINVSEIESCSKYGLAGFVIKLTSGKELRFTIVSGKMRDGITAAIEAHRGDVEPAEPAEPAAEPQAAPATEAAPVEVDSADASANKVMAILAYFGILVLVPLFAAKDSKFARFHANQGLILLICEVVIFFIGRIPGIDLLVWLLNIAIAVFAIIGIINAAKGEAKELPFIGKFRIIS